MKKTLHALHPALLPLLTLLLAGCAAESEQPDPTQVKLNDVDERLGRVERVVNNQSLVSLSQRIDTLEAQLRDLRGSVEELQNGDASLRKQQRDLYADLDKRIMALEASVKAAGASVNAASGSSDVAAAGGDAAASGGEQNAYGRAFDALKSTQYASAITQFKDFLHTYPQSSLGGNAEYWLGEAYYVTRDFDSASAAFRAVGEQYPQSRKVPDALLKLALTQIDQKQLTDARATLNQVLKGYPGTDAAKLAADRLRNLPPDAP